MCLVVLLIEIIALATMNSLGNNTVSNELVTLFIVLFSITLMMDVSRSERFSTYSNSFFLGYMLRVSLLYFDRYGQSIYHLPNSGADSETFYYNAMWLATGQPARRTGHFIILFYKIFSVIGINRLFGQFVIVLFSLVALYMLALTLDELPISYENRHRTFLIVALLPNFAILSSVFLRESIVCMFVAISFYFFVRYYNGDSLLYMVLSIGSTLLAMYFHTGAAGLLVGYTLVLFLHDPMHDENRMSPRSILIASIIGFVSVYLYLNYSDVLFTKMENIEDISDIANVSQYGGSSYLRFVGNSNTPLNMVIYTIPRIVFFLFSPFPWQWRGIPDVIAFFFSSLYYLYIVYATFRYIKDRYSDNRTLAINVLISTFFVVFVFAWGVSNTGTAARHRDKIVTLFAVLLGICGLNDSDPSTDQAEDNQGRYIRNF